MADTIREQLIAEFTARAQTLMFAKLERARRAHDLSDGVNASIWDGEDVSEKIEYGIQSSSFPIALEMQWELSANENASTALNNLLGNVVTALLQGGNLTLGDTLRYTSATPEYPADGSGLVSLTVIFTIYYSTKVGDPYTVA